ncbi:MAG: hypothetical protein MUO62_19215, partial [Anaerolineales bacterium]|nr:hypothetical protein [Anaerolineales bacterium]
MEQPVDVLRGFNMNRQVVCAGVGKNVDKFFDQAEKINLDLNLHKPVYQRICRIILYLMSENDLTYSRYL